MRINCCSIRRNKALRRMCFSARGAVSSTQCVLTSDAGPDTLVVRTSFRRNYADPNKVAAVILGLSFSLSQAQGPPLLFLLEDVTGLFISP